MEKVTETEMCI